MLKPKEPVVFHWKDKLGRRHSMYTTYEYFKNYAIELLEDEKLDKVHSLYYTLGNITKALDYYNEEFL